MIFEQNRLVETSTSFSAKTGTEKKFGFYERTFQFSSNKLPVYSKDRRTKPVPKHSPTLKIWGAICSRDTPFSSVIKRIVNSSSCIDVINEKLSNTETLYP